MIDPAVEVLADKVLNLALVGDRHILLGDSTAAIVEALRLIHGLLERIALPAEHVISVSTKATSTLEAPHKWVRTRSPQAVELGGVPYSLVDDLWHANGVGGRAWASIGETKSANGIVHVRLVIGAIEVLAIPACWEVVGYKNTSRARLGGEVRELSASVKKCLEAVVAEASMGLGSLTRAANGHTEAGLERLDRLRLDIVSRQIILGVVDRNATGDARCKGSIVDDRHTVIRSVSVLVVHDGSPVVGKVLGHLASSASTPFTHVTGHGGIEGISSNDMVKMGGADLAGLNNRVKALDGQC